MIIFYLFLIASCVCNAKISASNLQYRGELNTPKYFDPTVDGFHYKSLPQLKYHPYKSFSNLRSQPGHNFFHDYVTNSAFRSYKGRFSPRSFGYRILSDNSNMESRPASALNGYEPQYTSTSTKANIKVKDSLVAHLGIKNEISNYIPISISCGKNITVCKSAYQKQRSINSDADYAYEIGPQSTDLHSDNLTKIKFSIPKDFVPIFDDLDMSHNSGDHLFHTDDKIEHTSKDLGRLGDKTDSRNTHHDQLYYITHNTLFRDRFNDKVPSMPKYILSSIRRQN